MITCTALLLLPVLATAPAAGDTLVLDLDHSIGMAIADSHTALNLDLGLEGAEADVAAARGRFRTQADAEFDLPQLSEQVQRVQVPGALPRYDSYGTRTVSATLSLHQPLPTDGEVSLSGHIYEQNDSYYDETADQTTNQRTFFNSYEVSLAQPLFTPNSLRLGLEKAEISHRTARRAYERGKLDLAYDVTAAFYGLVKAQEQVSIARDALARQQQNYDLAQRKYTAGLIPEVDALQMEVDLANADNDLLGRESDLVLAGDSFRLLVGLPMDRPVRADADLTPVVCDVDPQLAISHALRHRTEIADLKDQLRRAQITVTETDARSHLRGELSAFYNLTGISDPALSDAGLGRLVDSSWDDLRRRPGNRGVKFSVSVPLWDSGVNAREVASAQVAVRRQELDRENLRRTIVRQVQASIARFEGAKRRLDVLKRGLDIALRSYSISRERFETGEITSQALADNRDRLVSARLSYLDAYVGYRLAEADLRRQTLYDFAAGASLVEPEPGATSPTD